jgi:4-amino-4-deoxy-L-arabinose transferase-like glycosyltransferase
MGRETATRRSLGLLWVPVVLGLWYPLACVAIALLRLGYPFELEWIEGAVLETVRRALAGQTLYPPPSFDFIALNYTPLYYHVCAWVARVIGPGFLALRLVSFLAALATFVLLYEWVRRVTAHRLAGVLAVSLYAATYRFSGTWFDVARADSLYLLLLLLALAVLHLDPVPVRAGVVAGVLFVAAFFAKQTALLVLLPPLALLLVTHPRRGWSLALTAGVLGALVWVWCDRADPTWFHFYTITVPRSHGWNLASAGEFCRRDLLAPVGIAMIIALLGGALGPRRTGGVQDHRVALAAIAGLIVSAWVPRLYRGGYDNVLMSAYAGVALAFGFGVAVVLARIDALAADARRTLMRVLALALSTQFVMLVYDPMTQIPTERDLATGRALVTALSQIEGRVLVPCHPYLLRMAGKPTHFHEMAYSDTYNDGHAPLGRAIGDEVQRAIAERRFDVIVLDNRDWLEPFVKPVYVPRWQALTVPDAMWPVTGMQRHPELIYARGAAAP